MLKDLLSDIYTVLEKRDIIKKLIPFAVDEGVGTYQTSFAAKALLRASHQGTVLDCIERQVRADLRAVPFKATRRINLFYDCLWPMGLDYFNRGDTKADSPAGRGQYPPIPLDIYRFIEGARSIPSFLDGKFFADIGSGLGEKAILMSLMSDMTCFGIECDWQSTIVAMNATRLLSQERRGRIGLFCGDANEILAKQKKHQLPNIDRVYTYKPCMDDNVLKTLYQSIWNFIQPGTIWWEALPGAILCDIVGISYPNHYNHGREDKMVVINKKDVKVLPSEHGIAIQKLR